MIVFHLNEPFGLYIYDQPHKAKNLLHNPGVTGWNAILLQDKPAQPLDKNMLADWQAKTPNGTITAPVIIMSANGHDQSFGFFKRRLMHVFYMHR